MAPSFLAAVEGEVAEAALQPGVVRGGGGGLDALHERPAALRARLDAAEVEEAAQVDVPGRAMGGSSFSAVVATGRNSFHTFFSCLKLSQFPRILAKMSIAEHRGAKRPSFDRTCKLQPNIASYN